MAGSSRQITIVIPVYCEAGALHENLRAIAEAAGGAGGVDFGMLIVDDGSTDRTWEIVRETAGMMPSVRAIRLSRNFGKEAAIAAGLAHAEGDAVIVMDADLQHPPALIPEMARLWAEEGFDVVDAVKRHRGREAFWYKVSARLFTAALCSLSAFDMRGASDFKLLDRKVVNAWLSMRENVTFYRAMTEWVGFRHAQLPMDVAPRAGGRSSWNFLRLTGLATTALTSFSTKALHIATMAGFLFVLAALVFGGYTVFRWFRGGSLEGFSTVILLQLTVGGILMITLGIIGEYLSTIFREVKSRPRYIIREEL
ncbi:MAG: glycosyltransferase family 2 protein [Candidatus Hydrogenedentes bacterium]|nr:glycosyltransferase family 2 protein [Candidatus Hydrogenedentota bacterium]